MKRNKNQSSTGAPEDAPPRPAWAAWAPALLAVAIALAYSNSLGGEFVFDDRESIVANPTIRALWPPWAPLAPPDGMSVGGRPIINLSLAINHAISGLNPWSYHLANMAIHILAALALFGIVRRTILRVAAEPLRGRAAAIALAAAALWSLHPLQTESVAYVIQRAESLMGLFYLATLYCFIRSIDDARPRHWAGLSIAACALGMGSKEAMATAPIVILLYDRLFVASCWMEIVDRRWRIHSSLMATWAILGALALAGPRQATAGLGAGLPPLDYLRNQAEIVPHYLRLAVWPRPLVLDYGWTPAKSWGEVWIPGAALAALLAGSIAAFFRWPRIGFLCCAVFVLLAPTSSVIPFTELAAEHRMYLPLAPLAILAALGGAAIVDRFGAARFVGWGIAIAACAALGAGTFLRNFDYKSEESIFADAMAHRPDNPRVRLNLGVALQREGRNQEAIAIFRKLTETNSDYAEAFYNLGAAMAHAGQKIEAVGPLLHAITRRPDYPEAHNNLGALLAERDYPEEALDHFQKAVTAKPDYAEAQNNLGNILARLGRPQEAIGPLEKALALQPNFPSAHNNLAVALAGLKRHSEALAHAEAAIAQQPDYLDAVNNAAAILSFMGRLDDAISRLRRAVELAPDNPMTRLNLATALGQKGALDESAKVFEEAIKLDEKNVAARNRYGTLLAMQGKIPEAVEQFKKAVEIDPENAEAKANLQKAQGMSSAPAAGSDAKSAMDSLLKDK